MLHLDLPTKLLEHFFFDKFGNQYFRNIPNRYNNYNNLRKGLYLFGYQFSRTFFEHKLFKNDIFFYFWKGIISFK